MIFDLLTPPQGLGPKKIAFALPIHVSNSHTEFGLISSTDLGGDSITERRMEGHSKFSCKNEETFKSMRFLTLVPVTLLIYSK